MLYSITSRNDRLRSGWNAVMGIAIGVALGGAGCSKQAAPPIDPAASKAAGKHASTSHTHVAPHGGQIQAVGDHHFELTYDGAAGRFTLYVLGEDESKPEPIEPIDIPLQVRDEQSGEFQSVSLAADAQATDPGGKASRFAGSNDKLAQLGHFTAVARVPVDGTSHRVSFQFVGGKPISDSVAILTSIDGYACPMACEKDKVYKQQGKCAVCKMKLEEHKAGVTAHADHNPKHGGQFFMAPDNWHHLEGTLVSPSEMRVYLYDNFTKPLDSAGFDGALHVQSVDEQDEPVGETVKVPIKPVAGKPYMAAELPETVKLPFQSEARLRFPKAKEAYLFNFDFKTVQHKDAAAP